MNKKTKAPLLFILTIIWAYTSSFWAYWTWEILQPFSDVWTINALGQAFFYIGGALFLHALWQKYADPPLTHFSSVVIFILLIFWSLFAAIWGFWATGTQYEIFDPGWFFDEAGHAFFGMALAISLLILHQAYSSIYSPLLRSIGEGHVMRDIIGEVALGGIIWETAELLWDLYVQKNYPAWLNRAQLNSVDTTLDILIAVLSAIILFFVYKGVKNIYYRLHGNESDEEAADAMKIIEYFVKRVHVRSRRELGKLTSFLNNSFSENQK
ncbi:MAG: hypothetical protein Q8Q41_00210 [bacterium]|nr:hypothetical protein [bacterium]